LPEVGVLPPPRRRCSDGLTIRLADAAASVADLGTVLPVVAALVVVNHVDAASALVGLGALFVAGALVYRLPIPAQPVKAAAAIAVATRADPAVIAAAGILLGSVLLLLAVTGAARHLPRLFPVPVIRGNQLGVGLLLLASSVKMLERMPGGPGPAGWLAVGLVLLGLARPRHRRLPMALLAVAVGVAWTLARHGLPPGLQLSPGLPSAQLPGASDLLTAATLLVVPQLPLTLGNAVVGTSDLGLRYFGERARRAGPRQLCLTSGVANLVSGATGGIPMCHGSSGLTAYHRAGARGAGTGLVAGCAFLLLGLLMAPATASVLALVPVPVLAGLLAWTAVHHALLVTDQRGPALAVALAIGAVGGWSGNLAYGMAVGVPLAFAGGRGGRRQVDAPAAEAVP
jgi:SulP family sulfate permease